MKTKVQILMLVFLCISQAQGQWIEWPVSEGGNGHIYLPVIAQAPLSWNQAALAATAQGGYLATLTTQTENDFVYSLIAGPQYWHRGELGPLLGGYQPPGSLEPAGGWTWITGEPWNFSNWATAQPDNGGWPEEGLHFWRGSRWNDQNTNATEFISYVIEREVCTPRKAKAVAEVINGFVVSATITDNGCGYTNPPVVLIQGGGGTGARARAVLENGGVTGIELLDAGSGYTSTPRIVIGSPPFVPSVTIAVSKVNVTQNVVLGWKYVLESSTNAVNWTPTGEPFVADSESIVTEFGVETARRLFRLRVVE